MTPWYDTRKPLDADGFEHRPPLDWWEHELAAMPREEKSKYRGLVWLMMLVCGAVWFVGTVMIVEFLVGG